MNALEKDEWEKDSPSGSRIPYVRVGENKRVVIHYHPKKTYRSRKLLKGLLTDIGWTVEDLKRLKLIKSKTDGKKT